MALAYDNEGRSNELIVTLAYGSLQALRKIVPALPSGFTRQQAEQQVVDAVRRRERDADLALHNPVGAWFLTEGNRLPDKLRSQLGTDHPVERLQRYLILRYSSVAAALNAEPRLQSNPAIASVGNNGRVDISWSPNDPYFAPGAFPVDHRTYQWGLHEMNFPAAWDFSTGHGYVGVMEPGVPIELASLPADVQRNHRAQMAYNTFHVPGQDQAFHAPHVLGIIGAQANNGIGVAGGCPTCSTVLLKSAPSGTITPATNIAAIARAIHEGAWRGMQVLNWSGGQVSFSTDYPVCGGASPRSRAVAPICDAIAFAHRRKILFVSAAGNGETDLGEDHIHRPQFPGEHPAVLAVAGAEEIGATPPGQQLAEHCHGSFWCQYRGLSTSAGLNRSNKPGLNGVYAPARSVVSTVTSGTTLAYPGTLEDLMFRCSDAVGIAEGYGDESGVPGDGYGSCTGTSMAAAYVSALAGIIRSINPLLPAHPVDHTGAPEARRSVQTIIRAAGTHPGTHPKWGWGMPDSAAAVADALAQTPNRLTPLFAFYSWDRFDYFYTTVPQMAAAAQWGSLEPKPCEVFPCDGVYETVGNTINGYPAFPDHREWQGDPRAQVWVFTTPQNPKSASVPLVPLYRFSWKCGDPTPYPPAICSSYPNHSDTVYSADPVNGVQYFESLGYRLDGIEGYIYPRSLPQPAGTTRLMRKYNPERDDHAIFPETEAAAMWAAGYTVNTGNTDWIGYVYPNTTGNVPSIQ